MLGRASIVTKNNNMLFKKNKNLELKKWHVYFLGLLIIFAIGYKISQNVWAKGFVNIRGQTIRVLVANNFMHRYKGWSNRDSMGNYGGMLFVFPTREQHTMVMRHMRFPLDIIWIDNGVIIDIAPNLPPDLAKNETDLKQYSARLPSSAVLEVPAGFVAKYGLKIGDAIKMSD